MNRSDNKLSDSDFRRIREELFRRAHETAHRIEKEVNRVLGQAPDDVPSLGETEGKDRE